MFEERFAGRVPDLRWRLVCLCLSGAFGGCEPGSSPSAFPARGVPEALGQAGGGESEPQLRWARGLLWPPWSRGRGLQQDPEVVASPASLCSQHKSPSGDSRLLVTPYLLVSAVLLSGGDAYIWSVLSVAWGVGRPEPRLWVTPDVRPSAHLFLPRAWPPPRFSLGRSAVWSHESQRWPGHRSVPVPTCEGDAHPRGAVKTEAGSVVGAGHRPRGQGRVRRSPGLLGGTRAGACRGWCRAARTGWPWRGSGT